MKMNQPTTRMSLLLLTLLAQLGVAPIAQADTVDNWTPWEENSPDGNDQNNIKNLQYQQNPDQTRMGTNGGNLLNTTTGDWVGYVLYDVSSSSSPTGTFTTVENGTNKLATLTLDPQVDASTLTISSDVAAFNMSFDQTNFVFFNESGSLFGGLVSQNVAGSTVGAYAVGTQDIEYSSDYVGAISLSRVQNTGSSYLQTQGNGYFGKVMAAADIAYLASTYGLNSAYKLSGLSRFGSLVSLNVDFAGKDWNGTWTGAELKYNSFRAVGTISGSTLTSTSLIGGNGGTAYDVQSGSVKGTLVGIANSIVEDLAVVGATTLNVGASSTTTTVVNDVFVASGGNK